MIVPDTPKKRHHSQKWCQHGHRYATPVAPFPAWTLINLVTYTMLPFCRELENAIKQRLLKEGKVKISLNYSLLCNNRYIYLNVDTLPQ